jgi:uncharacterized protein
MSADRIMIEVDQTQTVSGLLLVPARAFACCVLAHGAGAGMTHPFMAAVAKGLHERGMATLRYQFPAMENGSRRPDRPPAAHATVRAAVAAAAHLAPTLPLIAGGKSFGARMTSQAQAAAPLSNVAGLVFIGFPLHPAGKPSDDRARHLAEVRIPMLFLQGAHDALADRKILTTTLARLSGVATSHLIEYADHSFHVPVRSGTTDAQVLREVLDTLTAWARCVCLGKGFA